MKKVFFKSVYIIMVLMLFITGCSKNINNIGTVEDNNILPLDENTLTIKNLTPARDIIKESIINNIQIEKNRDNSNLNAPKQVSVTGDNYFALSKDLITINQTTAVHSYDFIFIEDYNLQTETKWTGLVTYYFVKNNDLWVLDDVNVEFKEISVGAVTGTVINSVTKLPVKEAVIYAVSGEEVTPIAESGIDGTFLIDNVVSNTYNIHVFKSGYDKVEILNKEITQGATVEVNIELSVNPDMKYTSLEGKVLDNELSPLSNVSVYLLNEDNTTTDIIPSLTDNNGEYSIRFVESGTYKLIAKIQDNIINERTVTVSNNNPNIIEIEDIIISNNKPQIISTFPAQDTIEVEVHTNIIFEVNAEDQDGDKLTYFWSCSDGDMNLSLSNKVVWKATKSGEYTVKVKIGDSKGLFTEKEFAVNVVNYAQLIEYEKITKITQLDNTIEQRISTTDDSGLTYTFVVAPNTFSTPFILNHTNPINDVNPVEDTNFFLNPIGFEFESLSKPVKPIIYEIYPSSLLNIERSNMFLTLSDGTSDYFLVCDEENDTLRIYLFPMYFEALLENNKLKNSPLIGIPDISDTFWAINGMSTILKFGESLNLISKSNHNISSEKPQGIICDINGNPGRLDENKKNIIIIHGILSKTDVLGAPDGTKLEDYIDSMPNVNVLLYNYNSFDDNHYSAEILKNDLKRIRNDNAEVAIIAHSNGNVVSRAAYKKLYEEGIDAGDIIQTHIGLSAPNNGGSILTYPLDEINNWIDGASDYLIKDAYNSLDSIASIPIISGEYLHNVSEITSKAIKQLIVGKGMEYISSFLKEAPVGILQLNKNNKTFLPYINNNNWTNSVKYINFLHELDELVLKKDSEFNKDFPHEILINEPEFRELKTIIDDPKYVYHSSTHDVSLALVTDFFTMCIEEKWKSKEIFDIISMNIINDYIYLKPTTEFDINSVQIKINLSNGESRFISPIYCDFSISGDGNINGNTFTAPNYIFNDIDIQTQYKEFMDNMTIKCKKLNSISVNPKYRIESTAVYGLLNQNLTDYFKIFGYFNDNTSELMTDYDNLFWYKDSFVNTPIDTITPAGKFSFPTSNGITYIGVTYNYFNTVSMENCELCYGQERIFPIDLIINENPKTLIGNNQYSIDDLIDLKVGYSDDHTENITSGLCNIEVIQATQGFSFMSYNNSFLTPNNAGEATLKFTYEENATIIENTLIITWYAGITGVLRVVVNPELQNSLEVSSEYDILSFITIQGWVPDVGYVNINPTDEFYYEFDWYDSYYEIGTGRFNYNENQIDYFNFNSAEGTFRAFYADGTAKFRVKYVDSNNVLHESNYFNLYWDGMVSKIDFTLDNNLFSVNSDCSPSITPTIYYSTRYTADPDIVSHVGTIKYKVNKDNSNYYPSGYSTNIFTHEQWISMFGNNYLDGFTSVSFQTYVYCGNITFGCEYEYKGYTYTKEIAFEVKWDGALSSLIQSPSTYVYSNARGNTLAFEPPTVSAYYWNRYGGNKPSPQIVNDGVEWQPIDGFFDGSNITFPLSGGSAKIYGVYSENGLSKTIEHNIYW